MEVERVLQHDHICYYVYSAYRKSSLAFEPGELMALQRWLQEHEDEITNDTLSNSVHHEMRGYTEAEIKHARELQETGITNINELVLQFLEDEQKESKE